MNRAGEETAAERRIRHEAHVEFAAGLNVAALGIARPEGIFHLQRDDRMHFPRPPYGVGAGLRQTDVARLALFHEPGHGSHRVFDGNFGIDARHAKDIETVDAEPLEVLLAVLRQIYRRAAAAVSARVWSR